MTAKPRKPLLVNLTWAGILVLPVMYVLSYAPVVRWEYSRLSTIDHLVGLPMDGSDLPLYAPVDWLIDHTPLRRPFFWWAGVFGVRQQFELSATYRHLKRLDWSKIID
jgi:hypothetical protein